MPTPSPAAPRTSTVFSSTTAALTSVTAPGAFEESQSFWFGAGCASCATAPPLPQASSSRPTARALIAAPTIRTRDNGSRKAVSLASCRVGGVSAAVLTGVIE
jgi:hypothetical protein